MTSQLSCSGLINRTTRRCNSAAYPRASQRQKNRPAFASFPANSGASRLNPRIYYNHAAVSYGQPNGNWRNNCSPPAQPATGRTRRPCLPQTNEDIDANATVMENYECAASVSDVWRNGLLPFSAFCYGNACGRDGAAHAGQTGWRWRHPVSNGIAPETITR